jgi:hypothetical protein
MPGMGIHDYSRNAVAAYLAAHFPDYKLGDRYDAGTKAQVFRASKKGQRYVLIVDETFFRNKTSATISSALQALEVADALYRSGTILLDDNGVHDAGDRIISR